MRRAALAPFDEQEAKPRCPAHVLLVQSDPDLRRRFSRTEQGRALSGFSSLTRTMSGREISEEELSPVELCWLTSLCLSPEQLIAAEPWGGRKVT